MDWIWSILNLRFSNVFGATQITGRQQCRPFSFLARRARNQYPVGIARLLMNAPLRGDSFHTWNPVTK